MKTANDTTNLDGTFWLLGTCIKQLKPTAYLIFFLGLSCKPKQADTIK